LAAQVNDKPVPFFPFIQNCKILEEPIGRHGEPGGHSQGMLCEEMIHHRPPADEVFLDDPLQDGGRARVIPGSLGINHGNRPMVADPEAIGLGPVDPSISRQAQFIQSFLQ